MECTDILVDKLPLVSAKTRKKFRIVSIHGKPEIQLQLASLGIFAGTEVQPLRVSKHGPMMIMVRGTRMALGHDLGCAIMVQEVDTASRRVV